MKTKSSLMMLIFLMTLIPMARASSIAPAEPGMTAEMPSAEARDENESDLYSEGTDAIDDEDWSRAARIFAKVVKQDGKRVDGALYWLAYAEAKAGRSAQALEAINALQRSHPASKWIQDAKALEISIKQNAGQDVDPSNVKDDELKLIAIQGLMSANPERAVPLLEKLVNGSYSHRIKEQALFVLSQSSSSRAAEVIASVARGKTHPELQKDAIKYLGVAGGRNLSLLGEIYQSADSAALKKEILNAYMVAGARTQLVTAARGEKDPKLRTAAIHLLGAMGETKELQAMYRSEQSKEAKKAIIEAMFVSGGADSLLEIVRSESDPSLKATAVRSLGLTGSGTAPTLVSIYQSDADPQIRRAALEGLFVQGSAHALVELAKSEKDPRWKREIVEKLSVMSSKEAIDYLTSLLD